MAMIDQRSRFPSPIYCTFISKTWHPIVTWQWTVSIFPHEHCGAVLFRGRARVFVFSLHSQHAAVVGRRLVVFSDGVIPASPSKRGLHSLNSRTRGFTSPHI
jgi:hypothetical protein